MTNDECITTTHIYCKTDMAVRMMGGNGLYGAGLEMIDVIRTAHVEHQYVALFVVDVTRNILGS